MLLGIVYFKSLVELHCVNAQNYRHLECVGQSFKIRHVIVALRLVEVDEEDLQQLALLPQIEVIEGAPAGGGQRGAQTVGAGALLLQDGDELVDQLLLETTFGVHPVDNGGKHLAVDVVGGIVEGENLFENLQCVDRGLDLNQEKKCQKHSQTCKR